MNRLCYSLYLHGRVGLSNVIMSAELGVILALLTDRLLVLLGNNAPVDNAIRPDPLTGASRVTDLLDLPVPWTEAPRADAGAREIADHPLIDSVFYYPASIDPQSEDLRAFAGHRPHLFTIDDNLWDYPALSVSGGARAQTLSFYSSFFYLDAATWRKVNPGLANLRPKAFLAELAAKIVRGLGRFNAVHVRRTDFKYTLGVTALDREPRHLLEALDNHFSRRDRLVILTDEVADPIFTDVTRAYRDHVFLDRHVLDEHRAGFSDLPTHDGTALAFLSQLVAAESDDFIGSMTSTFTALIQRYRGNRGRHEPFKFLWNELPDPGAEVRPGRHAFSECVPLRNGVMVEQQSGPTLGTG